MRWAAAGLVFALAVAPGRAQTPPDRCPAPESRPRIEVLAEGSPFVDERSTCGLEDDRQSYLGGTCGLQSSVYGDPDAVYKVRLNRGPALDNRVGFRLEMVPPTDLVLVLVRETDAGAPCTDQPCFAHSPDFIGSGTEEIPSRSYPPGIYYLFVDSATSAPAGRCGRYRIEAFGVNPTPDLRVELAARPAPVVAGTDLAYSLTVTNRGTLAATEVEAVFRLPPRTALRRAPTECVARGGRELLCRLGDLPAQGGTGPPFEIVVAVDPAARGVLRASAGAEAREGGQDVDQCEGGDRSLLHCAEVETDVDAVTDLVLTKEDTPEPVVAGCPLLYRLAVTNRGPSEATEVVVTDLLPEKLVAAPELPQERCPEPPEVPEGCSLSSCAPEPGRPRRLTCSVGRLGPREQTELCIVRAVAPSAGDRSDGTNVLRNRAEVAGAADERNPDPSTNTVVERTGVIRWTDLGIVKRALADTVGGATDELSYAVILTNHGPSESSGARITDPLPEDMSFLPSPAPAPGDCTEERGTITCETGPLPANDSRRISFTMVLAPDSIREEVLNEASVSPSRPEVETEPQHGDFSANDDSTVTTPVELVDLSLDKWGVPKGKVVAGENLLYRLTVANQRRAGRSFDSHGGRVLDRLEPDLSFVGSPDGCFSTERDHGLTRVECPFGLLPVDEELELRFVARVDPSAAVGELQNTAEIHSRHDPETSNDQDTVLTTILTSADLTLRKTVAPDPVETNEAMTHTLTVTNLGPSDARGVLACDLLLGGDFGAPPSNCQRPTGDASCAPIPENGDGEALRCSFEALAAGTSETIEIPVTAPSDRGVLTNTAKVSSLDVPDLVGGNDEATAVSSVAESGDHDLAITLQDPADSVVVGDPVVYTVHARHRGLPGEVSDPALDVRMAVAMSPGAWVVSAVPVSRDRVSCMAASQLVRCTLESLESNAEEEVEVTAVVVKSGTLSARAEIEESPEDDGPNPDPAAACPDDPEPTEKDPNQRNNCFVEDARAIEAPNLVMPLFEADTDELGKTTLFAVRNLDDSPVDVDYTYVSTRGKELFREEDERLSGQAVRAVNLRDLTDDPFPAGEPSEAGSVGISSTEATGRVLAGDFFSVDPGSRSASGSLLVDTDSTRIPRQLCRRWAVRFLNGGAFDGGTDFVFWTPPGPGYGALAKRTFRGRVYTEAGDFVQELTVSTEELAFSRSTRETFDGGSLGPDLLASFGAIEWDLGEGVVGNVSAVHRAEGRFAVGVPGVCLDPRPPGHQPGRDAPLVVPYFELDGGTEATTALFAIRNEAAEPVQVRIRYVDPSGGEILTPKSIDLDPRAVRTFNLRDVLRDALDLDVPEPLSGSVEIKAGAVDGQAPDDVFLSGDYFRLSPADDLAAGEALIDTGASVKPTQVCRRWVTRLLHGGGFVGATSFVFYAPKRDGDGEAFTGEVFDEAGSWRTTVELARAATSFQVGSGKLDLPTGSDGQLFGSVEWTFPEGRPGNVSTLFRADGNFSVLVPGICLEQ